ncbi:MAG: autotransporter-associated beta strand repeat-containing protein [Planctomycetia bacterium]
MLGNDAALGSDALVLSSGYIYSTGSNRTIANGVTLSGSITAGSTGSGVSGGLTFTGPFALAGTGTRTINAGNSITISGPVSGSATLQKLGGSSLTLSGTNTYSGGTVIGNGLVTFSSGTAFPAEGNVTLSGGALSASGPYGSVTSWLASNRINDNPNGALAITASSTNETIDFNKRDYAGLTNIANLSLGSASTLTYNGSFTPYTDAGGTQTYRLGGGQGVLTFAPAIADGTNPTQVVIRGDGGGGRVRLGSANTFTGDVTLISGYLDFSNDNQLANVTGATGNEIDFQGGTLFYSGTNTDLSGKFAAVASGKQASIHTNGQTVNFATPITGSGGLSKTGAGTLSATAAYSGATKVDYGTLVLSLSATAPAPTGQFTASSYSGNVGTLQLSTPVDQTVTGTVYQTAGGIVELSSAPGSRLTLSGAINRTTGTANLPGELRVTGGTVEFSGSSTNAVETDWTVKGGTLVLSSTRAGQTDAIASVAAGATVKLGASNQILTGVSGLSGTFDLAGYSDSFESVSGTGIVTNSSGSASTLTLTAGGTLTPTFTDSGSAGSLKLVFSGSDASQVLTMTNTANTYVGGTEIQQGVLAIGPGSNVLGGVAGSLTAKGTALSGSTGTVVIQSTDAGARTYGGEFRVEGPVTLGGTSTGSLTFAGPTTLVTTTTISNDGTVRLSGPIGSGTGDANGFTKTGAGLLVLSGTNTYGGPTTLASGTLLASGTSSGSGAVNVQGGLLQLGADSPLGSGTVTFAGGGLTSDGTTARTLANDFVISATTTLGDAVNSGTLTLSGNGTGSGVQSLVAASDAVLSGTLSGGLGLSKSGAGSLTINGGNTFTGGFTLAAGEVRAGSNTAFGSGTLTLTSGTLSGVGSDPRSFGNSVGLAGSVTLGDTTDNATLSFTGPATMTANATITLPSDVVFSGNIGNDGTSRTLTKAGAGTLTLSGSNSYGGTTLSAGRILLGGDFALGSTGAVTLAGGTLSSDGATARSVANPVSLGGTVTVGDATNNGALSFTGTSTLTAASTVTFASNATMNVVSGTYLFTKAGLGTLTITGTGGQAGTTIAEGTVRIGNATSLGGSGTVTLNQGVTLTGTGATALIVARPLVLAGNATLGAASGDTAPLTFSSTTSFSADRTLTVSSSVTLSGAVSGGSNALTKAGNGTLTLSASNAYGNTVVNAGVLRLGNDNALGTTGTATFAGGVTVTGTGTTARTISRPVVFDGNVTLGAATDTAALTFAGTSTLTGSRTLTVLSGVTLANVTGTSAGFDLTKSGSATLTLIGSGNYGNTILSTGILRLGSDTALGSGTLSLAAGTTLSGTGTVARSIANAITIQSGSVTLGNTTDSGTLALTGTTTLLASSTVGIASSVTMGPIAGQGFNLTKAGTAALTLTGTGDYGNTTLTAGRIRVASDAAFGSSGTVALTTGALSSDGAAARTIANQVTLTGSVTLGDAADTGDLTLNQLRLVASSTIGALSNVTIGSLTQTSGSTFALTKSGTGSLTLTGSNAYGNTTVNAGRLQLGDDYALGATGTLTLTTGGILSGTGSAARTIGNAVSLTGLATFGDATDIAPLAFTGTTTLTTTSTVSFVSDVTMAKLAGTSQAFTKSGTGTLTLTGSNTHGNTILAAGRVRAGNDGALSTGTVSLAGGTLSGTGSATRTIANAMTLNGSSTLGDTVDNGPLAFTGTSTLLSSSTLALLSEVQMGQITQAAGSTYSLTKAGAGTLTLTAASSYSGGTTLTEGRLRLGADNALGTAGTVTLAGGRLSSTGTAPRDLANLVALNGSTTLGDTTDSGLLSFSNGVQLLAASTVTLDSDVSMNAVSGYTLTKAGAATLTLTTPNSQAGTTLSAGRIRIGADAALGLAAALNGGTLSSTGTDARTISTPWSLGGSVAIGNETENGAFTFTGSGTLTANSAINAVTNVTIASLGETGSGRTLAKNGAGLVRFTGASTFTGPLDINAGTVFVQSGASLASAVDINAGAILAGSGTVGTITVGSGGTITPGNSPGTITSAGAVFAAGGNYNWQLFDVSGTAGNVNGWDLIQVGTGGTLDLSGLSNSSTFNLNLWTLSSTGPDVNGAPQNFVANTQYVFPIVRFDSLSSLVLPGGFGSATAGMNLTSLFTINLSGTNGTGGWSGTALPSKDVYVRVGASGTSLDIIVVPEPATIVLVGIGAACAAWAARRRRAQRRASRPVGGQSWSSVPT